MHIYVKNLSTARYKQASYFRKILLNNLFNTKHAHMYHSDTVHRHPQKGQTRGIINTRVLRHNCVQCIYKITVQE
jgi:hypothetical protein